VSFASTFLTVRRPSAPDGFPEKASEKRQSAWPHEGLTFHFHDHKTVAALYEGRSFA